MKAEEITKEIILIDEQLFELDEILSSSDEIDIHRYYELEAELITKKRKLITYYEKLIAL
jgi:hypothetical protein